MLELEKIIRDIDAFGRERAESFAGLGDQLAEASRVLNRMCEDPSEANARIKNAKTSWLTAGFDESPDRSFSSPQVPEKHAVVAMDGSQIVADKHEVALCYLINSASIQLFYGSSDRPVARTNPQLHFRDEDMFESFGGQESRVTGKQVAIRRTLAESAELEYVLASLSGKGMPGVALWDGSLILWSLQTEPPDYRKKVLGEYLRAFDEARKARVPIAGYVSDPGSRDFMNSMRIMLCDQLPIDCDQCSYRGSSVPPPCACIAKLKDSMFYGKRLGEGERSVLFTSSSQILREYGAHEIRAFYMNVGREMVRVEVPRWVAEDRELLDLTHAVCFDQARKGRGYPVALSEAHEHAVVRGPERSAFYQAVERSFVRHGARISFSQKRLSKGY